MRSGSVYVFGVLILAFGICWQSVRSQPSIHKSFDGSAYSIDTPQRETGTWILERAENFSQKSNPISKYLRSLFVSEKKEIKRDTIRYSEDPLKKYKDQYIRKVNIVVLDPFGNSVNQTYMRSLNRLEKIGNATHYTTRTWVIREQLLFKEKQRLDPYKVAESERLLRQDKYIHDAKIVVIRAEDCSDSVDVQIIAQDVLEYNATITGDPLKPNGSTTISDINFLGLGHRLDNTFWYDPQWKQPSKYNVQYTVPEIGKSFISANVHYLSQDFNSHYGISFSRPFYSSSARWAGGLSEEITDEHYSFMADSAQFAGLHQLRQQDVWAGYAMTPGIGPRERREKSQFIVSGRVINAWYMNRNSYEEEVKNVFQNQVFYLGSLAYSYRQYYKDNYIFGFGKTEDIPLGYLLVLTGGQEVKSKGSRPYTGFKAAYGSSHSSLGYLNASLEAGGFIHDRDFREGVISVQSLYFTPVVGSPLQYWKLREFLWNRFETGYNRLPGQLININDASGIRAMSFPETGTQKWVTNFETDLFTPYSVAGFRIAGVLFADFAFIGTRENPFYRQRLQQGYGIGVRLKNERLTFNTFQLSFHFYPAVNETGASRYLLYHTEQPYYRFSDFQFTQPNVAGY